MNIRHVPSPNFGPRRGGLRPSLVVLHYTAMVSADAALERLCDREAEVSAHYLIGRSGAVWQLVDEASRAWHAGAGTWAGAGDVNSRSIGIELDNDGASPFSEPLMAALEALLSEILDRWSIPAAGVIAHSDMAPDRKDDPGSRFDWRRLALRGLSVWPGAGGDGQVDFLAAARQFGYPGAGGAATHAAAVLRAFRLRFRPWADGEPDATDRAMIADLAGRFPVDRGAADA